MPFPARRYSASAAVLKEEEAKATFSPPPRRHVPKDTFSPEAYMFDLPTIGRRRTSPVMTQDHFSPGGNMHHPQWFSGNNRIAAGEKVVRIDPQCFVQGRWLAHHEGRNAVSRSLPAWLLRRRPLSGPPGGTTLAAYLR